jgi:hypothetical protein
VIEDIEIKRERLIVLQLKEFIEIKNMEGKGIA